MPPASSEKQNESKACEENGDADIIGVIGRVCMISVHPSDGHWKTDHGIPARRGMW